MLFSLFRKRDDDDCLKWTWVSSVTVHFKDDRKPLTYSKSMFAMDDCMLVVRPHLHMPNFMAYNMDIVDHIEFTVA